VQALESIPNLSGHRSSSRLHLGHRCFTYFGCTNGFSQNFATHFLDEVLFQDMVHIDNLPLLGNNQIVLNILFSCEVCHLFISYGQYLLFLLSCLFGEFRLESYVGMWGHYGSRIVGIFLTPLNEVLSLTTDIL